MSYQLKVIKDHPIGFWKLDETSGTVASDLSGCNNNATYSSSKITEILPLVVGSNYATKINDSLYVEYNIVNDYYGSSEKSAFAIDSNSDEPFSLEAWFYPKITSTAVTPILGDSNSQIGLFYDNGNILFNLQSIKISYTLKDPNRAIHVVGTYGGKSMTLYVDGEKVVSETFNEFLFTNTSIGLKSGPTSTSDYFIINNVAIYRYELSEAAVLSHYNYAKGINPEEVIKRYSGEIFAISDTTPNVPYRYSYPGNRAWNYLLQNGLVYNSLDNSLSIKKTVVPDPAIYSVVDFISLPASNTMDSSKIEWTATKNISVYISTDEVNWIQCENGATIPGYTLNSFSTISGFYLKIEFVSSDTSIYLPKIWDLMITFYNNQITHSTNGSSYFSTLEGVPGVVNFDAVIGNKYSPILFRGSRNGVKTFHNSAFHITANYGISTIEFFYTPDNFDDDGGLISTSDGNGYLTSHYYWNNSGNITKTSISAIYINGVNKYSETHIQNVFEAGNLYHVVIVFPAEVSGDIEFNHSQNGATAALFQNIALYEKAFIQDDVLENYNLYRLGSYISVEDDSQNVSMQITENSANYYNNDWIVYQTQ